MMRGLKLFLAMSLVAASAVAGDIDYSDGIIVVNEDWYGHQNSTLNFLKPDASDGVYWNYRIVQSENPGYELGCTNQYGALWEGRLYLIAKQDKDPGAEISGGRITVVEAADMKMVRQLKQIDPSGAQCDGRAFCGVTPTKGYVSSSNGIWILNLETLEIEGQVEGSANPNAGGDNDKPNTDPTSSLYFGQTGTMILTEGRVFAVHQQYGLLVIDPEKDRVTEVLDMEIVNDAIERDSGTRPRRSSGIGSTIVRSKDGDLWYSASKNVQGTGSTVPYIIRLNPVTLEREVIAIEGEGLYPPSNSWYAWTPDPFCASEVTNTLYWCGGSSSWFTNNRIFKYDIDKRTLTLLKDFTDEPGDWHVYGCSLGIHPVTDELYASMFHKFVDPTYVTRRYDSMGNLIKEYPMISNYWFPSHFIFPRKGDNSGVDNIAAERETGDVYSLQGVIIATAVPYENVFQLSPGIYIWKSGDNAKKILVK